MDDLESFKEARLKMDPTARKMSSGQWKRAYEAHLRAKERVSNGRREGQSGDEDTGTTSGKRSRSTRGSRRGLSGYSGGDLGSLRRGVREQSGYSDLRLIIDVLSWVVIGVVVLTALVPLFFNTPIPVSLVAVLNAVIGVISVIVIRLLAQMLIDIPDIALYRLANAAPDDSGAAPDSRDTEKVDGAK